MQAQTQGYLTPNVDEQVRLQLIATSTTGETFAETAAGGALVFHNLTGPWQALSMTRDSLQIARVRARVFVPRTHPVFGPEWRIAIDRVCPRPR